MLTRPHHADPTADTVVTYRYTSPQFAQDTASLRRLQRHDRRVAALLRVAAAVRLLTLVGALGLMLADAGLHMP